MSSTQKACIIPAPGQNVVLQDRPIPTPGPGQVLVKITATARKQLHLLAVLSILTTTSNRPVNPVDNMVSIHKIIFMACYISHY